MTQNGKYLSIVILTGVLCASVVGCDKMNEDKKAGPAERVGQSIDKGAEKAGQKIENAGEAIQDAAKGDKK